MECDFMCRITVDCECFLGCMIDPEHVQRWNISSDISSRLVGEEETKAAMTLKMKLSAVLVLSCVRILWTSILCWCSKCSLSDPVHSFSLEQNLGGSTQEGKVVALHRAGSSSRRLETPHSSKMPSALTMLEIWATKLDTKETLE